MKKRLGEKTWDLLPETIRAMYTLDEWCLAVEQSAAEEEEREKRSRTRPADWVEPSITFEAAEADPFCWNVADLMRTHGLTVLTRSQYFEFNYSLDGIPRPWTAELESNLPTQLQDKYLWVPRKVKRQNAPGK